MAKSAESIEELSLSERLIFHRLCDTVTSLGYIVRCGLFIHDCAVKHAMSCELSTVLLNESRTR